jgi:hypothetical protein
MKSKLTLCLLIVLTYNSYAQNTSGKSDDAARIKLAAYVPKQIEDMPEAARSSLANKLSQIVTQNGLGGKSSNERFIITANINIISKELTPTAPPLQAYVLDVTLYIGDGIDGSKFSSISTEVKGIGESETKAYISALKNIKTTDPKYQTFIETGKNKIIEYYNSKCDFIISEAKSLAKQTKYEEGIFKLTGVPEVCKDCYSKCMNEIAIIYQEKIDRDALKIMIEANALWAAGQDIETAQKVVAILAKIEPSSSSIEFAEKLAMRIAQRVKEIDNREWKYTVKAQQQESERIEAERAIGVAFGQNQPQTIEYNIIGWW